MIRFHCPSCREPQETPLLVLDLTRGQKATCLKCGVRLALVLGVYTKDQVKQIIKRKEGN
jgi:hypothetical protein